MHTTEKTTTQKTNDDPAHDLGQMGEKRSLENQEIIVTDPNGRTRTSVIAGGVKKSVDMPAYVRLGLLAYPIRAETLMKAHEARMLAQALIEAADEAEGKIIMTTTTAATTTTGKRKPAARPKKVVSPRNLPPQVIGEMYLIPLANIRVSDQVRTEFNEESIAELAAEIEERGLRSPIEVSPIGDELYELTTGERRLRAIQKLGHKAIPAIIVKTSDDERLLVQLAENIQREDLSLKDTIKAVRALYDRYGKADDVARRVKKSKAWVSKHLAASFDDLCWHAKNLMEDGFEDLELLGVVNQAYKEIGPHYANEIDDAIREGCGRNTARAMLKSAKANIAKPTEAQQSLPGVESVTVHVTTTETTTTESAADISPPAPPSTQKKRRPLEIIPFLRELIEFDYPVLAYEPGKTWKVWDKKSPLDAKLIEDGAIVYRLPDVTEIM